MENETNEIFKKRYLKTYECMIERIKKFIFFVDKIDPNAIVIVQSDHGIRKLYKNPFNLKRYKILSLIKVDDQCKDKISNKIDNLNSVRLALSCATSTPPKILKKKSFYRKTLPNNKNLIYEIPFK